MDICGVERPWSSAFIRKIMQGTMHNIEKIVERTFEILQCLKHNILKCMFNHFFCFMYEINIFEYKRS